MRNVEETHNQPKRTAAGRSGLWLCKLQTSVLKKIKIFLQNRIPKYPLADMYIIEAVLSPVRSSGSTYTNINKGNSDRMICRCFLVCC